MSANANDATRTFVVIEGDAISWALYADLVQRVVLERDWDGPSPHALSSLSSADDDGWHEGESRVLVTEGTSILGRGRIGMFTAPESDILPLPPLLRDVASHVVFREKATPLLIVDMDALARRAR